MIFVGLGANLPSRFGSPEQTLEAAKLALDRAGVTVVASSHTWRSAPVPVSDDPWYCNAVVAVETDKAPRQVLEALLAIEDDFGRQRSTLNAPRLIDLDLLAYDDEAIGETAFVLPHPRMHERAFVLLPLREITPGWRHPVLDKTIDELIEDLPADQVLKLIEEDAA
ncbi:MAG: 7,8-dihydro-6-hydroxymethylpterin-pyrophosphokina se [Micavibrio sp.]|nr:MAG: 7,8-dihydro-6-hydroxymethylpterin-pyrophosphokina se [Micavibrio sp.]